MDKANAKLQEKSVNGQLEKSKREQQKILESIAKEKLDQVLHPAMYSHCLLACFLNTTTSFPLLSGP
jgi:hypothetical protein